MSSDIKKPISIEHNEKPWELEGLVRIEFRLPDGRRAVKFVPKTLN